VFAFVVLKQETGRLRHLKELKFSHEISYEQQWIKNQADEQ
jgi:hypothetical protein